MATTTAGAMAADQGAPTQRKRRKRRTVAPKAVTKVKATKSAVMPKRAISVGLKDGKTAASEPKRKAMGTKRSGASFGAKAKPANAKPPSAKRPAGSAGADSGGARPGYRKRIEAMDL